MSIVALCVEGQILESPELLGLDGENLVRQSWLRIYSEAQEARRALALSHDIDEVWVASCESVDPINLAATIKHDVPSRSVYLIAFSQSGSLLSRAHSAGIDGVLGRAEFVGRYLCKKRQMGATDPHGNALGAQPETPKYDVGPRFSERRCAFFEFGGTGRVHRA